MPIRWRPIKKTYIGPPIIMAYTTKWKWKFMYSNESVYVCLYCVLYVLWPHSKHTDAVCKKKKINRIYYEWNLNKIDKKDQPMCVFDFETIHIFLSFFWYTVLFLCFFWVARIYIIHRVIFFSLYITFLYSLVSQSCVWLWLYDFQVVILWLYVVTKRIYTSKYNIQYLEKYLRNHFLLCEKFPMKKRKLLRWFKFRCDGNNIKIFCFFFGTQKKSISMAIISIVVVERSHSVNIYIHWFTDKRIDKIRLGGK